MILIVVGIIGTVIKVWNGNRGNWKTQEESRLAAPIHMIKFQVFLYNCAIFTVVESSLKIGDFRCFIHFRTRCEPVYPHNYWLNTITASVLWIISVCWLSISHEFQYIEIWQCILEGRVFFHICHLSLSGFDEMFETVHETGTSPAEKAEQERKRSQSINESMSRVFSSVSLAGKAKLSLGIKM